MSAIKPAQRITASEYRALTATRRAPKYGAKRTATGFDSKGEEARYATLQLLERTGQISDLKRQVRIMLYAGDQPLLAMTDKGAGRHIGLTVDFVYQQNGQTILEDFKGVETREFRLKRAIIATMGMTLVISSKRSSPTEIKSILP